MLTSKQIREKWLRFFEKNNHLIVPSQSLIPYKDDSLLWINSGVATLKDYFSGKKIPPSPRLTNSQKAIRTNDIENVGVTSRHHTFFEMLGNFSIGDYFKKEAIAFGYEFVFQELKLAKDKIYITYFHDDIETKERWIELGIDPSHLIPGDRSTNFWDIGKGPCGPCTEIFYDRGSKYDSRGVELLKEDIENDRFIEIWNIVFSEFNNDGENNYTKLIQKNIDTGAGLERITAIMQDVPTNFDTDLFLPIIKEIEKMTKYHYDINNYFTKEPQQMQINTYFKVIADHMRSCVNAINDGAKPSNISRGYIIRRLIRRSYRSGIKLGIEEKAFLYKLVPIVKDSLVFDIDVENVQKIIYDEEILFSETINQGQKLLEKEIQKNNNNFSFDIAFKLFETYGFPIELTEEILKEKGIKLDISQFEEYRQKHSEISRGDKKQGMKKVINSLTIIENKISDFVGYSQLETISTPILLLDEQKQITNTTEEQESYLVLDHTPFYATSGGQKHDQGFMIQNHQKIMVLDVFKDKFGNHIHHVQGKLNNQDPINCYVDPANRTNLERNHSATHLLFKSLREQFDFKIEQLGSDNNEERLTFDFPSEKKPTIEQINEIEQRVKSYIALGADRHYIETTINQAKDMNAIMTLEEAEYMDANNVRLVKFDNITVDLCGGTHISNTRYLENFKIVNVENKGSGIFRIKAITSNHTINTYLKEKLLQLNNDLINLVNKIHELKPDYQINQPHFDDLEQHISWVEQTLAQAREDLKQLKKNQDDNFEFNPNKIIQINKYQLYLDLELENHNNIKQKAAEIREQNPGLIVILGANLNEKKMLVIATKVLNSKEILDSILKLYQGRGGGSAIIAQGTCDNNEQIVQSIQDILGNL